VSEITTILISEVKQLKTGTNKKGSWTLYGLIDGNDEIFGSWFNDTTIRDAANELVGEKADVEWDPADGGRKTVKSVLPTKDPTVDIKPGTRAQAAPEEARRILLCCAWERAVDLAKIQITHTTSRELTPELIYEIAQEHRVRVFQDLLRASDLMTDEDIPFMPEFREVA
jgi:hypothetical protein